MIKLNFVMVNASALNHLIQIIQVGQLKFLESVAPAAQMLRTLKLGFNDTQALMFFLYSLLKEYKKNISASKLAHGSQYTHYKPATPSCSQA
jgi:hypothetical protein